MTTIQNPKIGGRYQVKNSLGKSFFGTTFLAEDMQRPGNPKCVVKQLTPLSRDPYTLQVARKLFDQEAETLERLGHHDQIPRLLAHLEENQEFYLVEEYIEGHDISQEVGYGKCLSETEVTQLLCEILEILAFVHQQNYIHRDIKPPNIRRRSSDGKLVLLDFGAVKRIFTQTVNSQGQITATVAVGTPGYMPSEQAKGEPQFSSDVYAVGIIGIQALTGTNPQLFPIDKTGEIVWRNQAQVSNKLANVLNQMVRYDYRQRYQSASETLQALSSNGLSWHLPKWGKKHVVFGLSGLLFLGITIGGIFWQIRKPLPETFLSYENPSKGIKIKYPASWQEQDTANPIIEEVVTFILPQQSNQNKFKEEVAISIEKFSGTLDESVKTFSKEISNQYAEAKVLETSNTVLAKKTARKLVFTSNGGEKRLKILRVWALKGDKAYVVTYTADLDDYEKYLRTAETIINSFEIN